MTDSANFFGDVDELAAYDVFSVEEAEDLLFLIAELLAERYGFKRYATWLDDCKIANAGRPGGFPTWLMTETSCRRRYAEEVVKHAGFLKPKH